jgi:hypothetical protein
MFFTGTYSFNQKKHFPDSSLTPNVIQIERGTSD